MKNFAASSEKRGCGISREERRGREREHYKLAGTQREPDTPRQQPRETELREKFQVKNTPHSLSHSPAYGLLRKASRFGQEGQR